jgi:endonuclease YncB( thermonuclease family)
MLQLSNKWGPRLTQQPETGMGYQIATVVLSDGRRFNDVLIQEGLITRIKGLAVIPFSESEIIDIVVTGDPNDPADKEWIFNLN